MAEVIGWLATYLLHSTVLITLAFLVSRWVPLRPATRDFVWRLALVGGLVTATGVVVSKPGAPNLDARRASFGDPFGSEAMPLTDQPTWRGEAREIRVRAVAADPTPECRATLAAGRGPDGAWIDRVREACVGSAPPRWYRAAVLLWLLGATLGLVKLLWGYRAERELRASLAEATPRARAALEELGGHVGSVQVRSSSSISSPCVLSGSTIGIPARCEDDLSDRELRAVLAHELAHVARRDFWWSGVLRFLCALFWLQPLNRVALRGALEAAELTCDDWALARLGERRSLATSISLVAQWAVSSPVAVPMAGFGGASPAQRVRRILEGREASEPRWLRAAIALLLLLPIPLLPPIPAPATAHAAIFVDDRTETAMSSRPGVGGELGTMHRVVVARVEGR